MGQDPSEIRREIEATRARMDGTIDALSYKADVPARMKEAVSDKVETITGTIGDVVESAVDTIAGVTGAVGSALGGAKRATAQTWHDRTDALGETASGEPGESLVSKLGTARSTMTTSVTKTVKKTVGSVADKLPDTDGVKSVAKRGVGIAVENPLGLALGALAVGFLAGLAAPVTDLEREKVGPIRDDLVERAKAAGTEAFEHGKDVLQETAQTVLAGAVETVQGAAQDYGKTLLGDNGDGGSKPSADTSASGSAKNASAGTNSSGNASTASNGNAKAQTGGNSTGAAASKQTGADAGTSGEQYGVLLDEDDTTGAR